ncbi:MAG: nuclear transport factor 2 family protein [Pseudomonadota bacterium]
MASAEDEVAAIRTTVVNSIEGWHTADARRMASSLNKDLRKVKPLGSQGRGLRQLDKTALVNSTRSGYGKTAVDKRRAEISQIDVYGNIASAKLVSLVYVDYFHLMKVKVEWQIMSAIWTRH